MINSQSSKKKAEKPGLVTAVCTQWYKHSSFCCQFQGWLCLTMGLQNFWKFWYWLLKLLKTLIYGSCVLVQTSSRTLLGPYLNSPCTILLFHPKHLLCFRMDAKCVLNRNCQGSWCFGSTTVIGMVIICSQDPDHIWTSGHLRMVALAINSMPHSTGTCEF